MDYVIHNELAECIFSAEHRVATYFLTAKGKQWIRDHAPIEAASPLYGDKSRVICAYCESLRDATIDSCPGCGARRVL